MQRYKPGFTWKHNLPIRSKPSMSEHPTKGVTVAIGTTINVVERVTTTVKGKEIGFLKLEDGRGWVAETNAKSGKAFFVEAAAAATPTATAASEGGVPVSPAASAEATASVSTPAAPRAQQTHSPATSAGGSPEMDLAKSDGLRAALQSRQSATNALRRALGESVPEEGDAKAEPPPPPIGAAAAAPARVWKAVRDKKSGRTYYVHNVTKATSWDRPDDAVMVKKIWKPVLDKRTGRTYYVNQQTKATTWEKPKSHLILATKKSRAKGSGASSGGQDETVLSEDRSLGGPGPAAPGSAEAGAAAAAAAAAHDYGALGPIYAFNITRTSGSPGGGSDTLMLDAVMAAIDLEGGVREFYKNWETSNGRSISSADMLVGLKQAEIEVTMRDCQRIVYSYGAETIGWGQLLRVLNGEVSLAADATVEESIARSTAASSGGNGGGGYGSGYGHGMDSTTMSPGGGNTSSRSLADEMDARYPTPETPDSIGVYDRQPRTASDARPVGGRDHIHMESASGENAAAREAFNSLSGSGTRRTTNEAGLSTVAFPARDRTMLRAIMDGIDDQGGARSFFKRWDVDGDKLLTHRELYEGLQESGVRISPNDCKRLTSAVSASAVSMGQLLRIVGGRVELPSAADAHAFQLELEATKAKAASHAASTSSPPAQSLPYGGTHGQRAGSTRREDPHMRFEPSAPSSSQRGAEPSFRSPVGGNDHIRANLSTHEGSNAQARVAFNQTHGSGMTQRERDATMLAAVNDTIDECGGIRKFFSRFDHDGSRTLNAAELCAGMRSNGMSVSPLDCARMVAAFGGSSVTNGQLHRLLAGHQPLPVTVAEEFVPTSASLDPNNRAYGGHPGGEIGGEEEDDAVAAGGNSARSLPQWAKLEQPRANAVIPSSAADTVEILSRGASAARARATFTKARGVGLNARERDHMLVEVMADVIDQIGGVRKALHEWDSDGDGAVTGSDLLRGMLSAAVPMTEEDCLRLAGATNPSEPHAISDGKLSMGGIVKLLRFDLKLPLTAPVLNATTRSVSIEPAASMRSSGRSSGGRGRSGGRFDATPPPPPWRTDADSATPGPPPMSAAGRAAADRVMMKRIMDEIDDNGGTRGLFRKWDTNGGRGLNGEKLYAGLQGLNMRAISLEDCGRISNAFGTGSLSMGELIRVLGGSVPLPDVAVVEGAGAGARRSLGMDTIDATPAAGARSDACGDHRGRQHTVGPPPAVVADNMPFEGGVSIDAREAFNRVASALAQYSGNPRSAPQALVERRNTLILSAVALCIDTGGGAARFFSKWDKDNDHMLSARELRRGLVHEGLVIAEGECSQLIRKYSEDTGSSFRSDTAEQRMTMRELKALLSESAPLTSPTMGGPRVHSSMADALSPFGSATRSAAPQSGRRQSPYGNASDETQSAPVRQGRNAMHAPGGEDHIDFAKIGQAADHLEFQGSAFGPRAENGSGTCLFWSNFCFCKMLWCSPPPPLSSYRPLLVLQEEWSSMTMHLFKH
mgnify:CR=1 FL=1